MDVTVKMEGVEAAIRALTRLPGAVGERAVRFALRKAGKPIEEDMKRRAARDSGKMAESIKTRTTRDRATGDIVAKIAPTGDRSSLAHLVEFGTGERTVRRTGRSVGRAPAQPFMRPAIDAKHQEAIKIYGEELGKSVDRATKRLNQK